MKINPLEFIIAVQLTICTLGFLYLGVGIDTVELFQNFFQLSP